MSYKLKEYFDLPKFNPFTQIQARIQQIPQARQARQSQPQAYQSSQLIPQGLSPRQVIQGQQILQKDSKSLSDSESHLNSESLREQSISESTNRLPNKRYYQRKRDTINSECKEKRLNNPSNESFEEVENNEKNENNENSENNDAGESYLNKAYNNPEVVLNSALEKNVSEEDEVKEEEVPVKESQFSKMYGKFDITIDSILEKIETVVRKISDLFTNLLLFMKGSVEKKQLQKVFLLIIMSIAMAIVFVGINVIFGKVIL